MSIGDDAPRLERKQVGDLTLGDLARCPVWEFALDEEGATEWSDEETLRPRPDIETPDPSDGLFVLAARFRARDGTEFAGYVTPDEAGARAEAPHVVNEEGQQVAFWHGMRKPSRAELDSAYQALGRDSAELFPLRVEAVVPTTRGSLVDEIVGFGYLDRSGETGLIV